MTRTLALIFACSVLASAADVAGKWNLTAKDPDDITVKAELFFQQNGGQWSGSVKGDEGTIALRNVAFDGGTLTFTLNYEEAAVTLKMKLEGNALKGMYTTDLGPSGPAEATRAAQAATGAAGVWNLKTVGQDGDNVNLRLTLKEERSAWRGQIVGDAYDLDVPVEDVKVQAGSISFRVPTEMGTYSVVGQVSADSFEGTATAPDGSKSPIKGAR